MIGDKLKRNIIYTDDNTIRVAPVTNTLEDIDIVAKIVEFALSENRDKAIEVFGYDVEREDENLVKVKDSITGKYRTVKLKINLKEVMDKNKKTNEESA